MTALPQSIFWKEPLADKASDVMVASKQLKQFKLDLKKLDLKFSILVRSVHNLILKQGGVNRKAPNHLAQLSDHNMTWDSYRCSLWIYAIMGKVKKSIYRKCRGILEANKPLFYNIKYPFWPQNMMFGTTGSPGKFKSFMKKHLNFY